MTAIDILLEVLLVGVAVAGAAADLAARKIYDWLSYPGLVLGLLLQLGGHGLGEVLGQGLWSAVFGAGFCAVVFGVFWLWSRSFGAGDVKLMAAVGALAGFVHSLTCAMCVALAGAGLALFFLLVSRKRLMVIKGFFRFRQKDGEQRLTVPYGVAIALGVIWATLIRHRVFPGF